MITLYDTYDITSVKKLLATMEGIDPLEFASLFSDRDRINRVLHDGMLTGNFIFSYDQKLYLNK